MPVEAATETVHNALETWKTEERTEKAKMNGDADAVDKSNEKETVVSVADKL